MISAESSGGAGSEAFCILNARAQSRGSYCVLANVLTPPGARGATFTPDGGATGGDLFDVVGDPPNNVVYNDASHDVIAWVP